MSNVVAKQLVQPMQRGIAAEANPCAACQVRDLSICGAIEPEHLGKLDAIVVHKKLAPGEILFFEGDRSDSLYIITEGCVRLSKMLADGRRQITGFLFPSDFLGLALRERYAYSAEAVDTVALCRYLQLRLPGFDYERDFGGVYYLFLRGMSPDHGSRFGVFFERPPRTRIDALGAALGGGAR